MICRTLKIADLEDWQHNTTWLAQRSNPSPQIENAVKNIIDNVQNHGDEALIKYTRQYDCPDFTGSFSVSPREIEKSVNGLPQKAREYLEAAIANIKSFHEKQAEKSWFMTRKDGSVFGQMITPVEAVGLYVPGGQGGSTPLVSSLLMNAIPAIVAGCDRIAVVSPPRRDGTLNENLLAAAGLLDIREVYRTGGAWSIAALACGTETIKMVDVIAGPGNIYVTTAKKLLQGKVGIDMIAGPSEVLIICDGSANPAWVAADMLSQAEHDTLASALCLVESESMAEKISQELENQLKSLPRSAIASRALANWSCIAIVPDLSVAISISNKVAPEHLEICTSDPWRALPYIRHAGAVFLGQNSPEPLGDYFAGPNHVLPTLGTARFSSALSVQTFCKKTSILAASEEFLKSSTSAVACLARMEGLEAHARSMEIRKSD